jgi:hypothetical protein
MPVTGLPSQIGVALEVTPGTRVVPNTFFEFNSESLQFQQTRIPREGLRAGRRMHHGWSPGVYQVGGQINLDLSAKSTGKLFRAALGSVNTTGAGPYAHSFTPGPLPSLTIQKGIPTQPFDYTGCYVRQWELSAEVDQHVKMQLDIAGMNEVTSETLATASYAQDGWFTFVHGSLTVGGVATPVDTISLSCDNAIDLYHQIKSSDAGRPSIFENGRRLYTGQLVADFEGLTQYNYYKNATEAALVLTFSVSASASLVITTNVRFDGETPTVSGPEIVKQPLSFTMTSNTSDAAAITAVLTNTDTTP